MSRTMRILGGELSFPLSGPWEDRIREARVEVQELREAAAGNPDLYRLSVFDACMEAFHAVEQWTDPDRYRYHVARGFLLLFDMLNRDNNALCLMIGAVANRYRAAVLAAT